jgi:hypothetical protein
MKKTVFKSFLILVVLGSASVSMAATSIYMATTLGNGNSFSPSNRVGFSVFSTQVTYSVTSCHINGTYEYGAVGGSYTTADASKIYFKNIPTQTITNPTGQPDPPTTYGDLPGGYASWTVY